MVSELGRQPCYTFLMDDTVFTHTEEASEPLRQERPLSVSLEYALCTLLESGYLLLDAGCPFLLSISVLQEESKA